MQQVLRQYQLAEELLTLAISSKIEQTSPEGDIKQIAENLKRILELADEIQTNHSGSIQFVESQGMSNVKTKESKRLQINVSIEVVENKVYK